MQYRLRTLLIVLAMGPILGAWGYRAVGEHLRYRRMREEVSKIRSPPWPPPLLVRPTPGPDGLNVGGPDIDPEYPLDPA